MSSTALLCFENRLINNKLQVVGDPKVCTALLDVIHSLLSKLLGTPTTAENKRAGRQNPPVQ